jgi:hypothetical protein
MRPFRGKKILAKMGDLIFHQIMGWGGGEDYQLLDTCFSMVDLLEAKSSWVCTNFCIFLSFVISLIFDISSKYSKFS